MGDVNETFVSQVPAAPDPQVSMNFSADTLVYRAQDVSTKKGKCREP